MRVLFAEVASDIREAMILRGGAAWTSVGVVEDAREIAGRRADLVIHDVRSGGETVERLERATFGCWQLLTHAGPSRYLQLSSMAMFEAYDDGWAIDERWQPRPTFIDAEFVPYLAERTAREMSRRRPVAAVSVRLGRDDDAHEIARVALDALNTAAPQHGWRAVHAPRAPRTGAPAVTPRMPLPASMVAGELAPRRIAVFGAGGPLGAASASAISDAGYRLVLSDVVRLAERASAPPQQPGAPVPEPVGEPHREVVADVTDMSAVLDIVRESDVVVNCSVVRSDASGAFRVNLIGAYTVLAAALAAGAHRVVHTGPATVLGGDPVGYDDDHTVTAAAPPRAGDDVYLLTKLLALELCRIAAESTGLPVLILQFVQLSDPRIRRTDEAHPFTVSWRDGGRAVTAALTAKVTAPLTVFNIHVESPHGRYATDCWERLGVDPLDRFDHVWHRDDVPREERT